MGLHGLFVVPINQLNSKQEELSVLSSLREYSQMQLKDALTQQAAKDLENLKEGSTAYKTIISEIDNRIKVYNTRHQPKGQRGVNANTPKTKKTAKQKQAKNQTNKTNQQKTN